MEQAGALAFSALQAVVGALRSSAQNGGYVDEDLAADCAHNVIAFADLQLQLSDDIMHCLVESYIPAIACLSVRSGTLPRDLPAIRLLVLAFARFAANNDAPLLAAHAEHLLRSLAALSTLNTLLPRTAVRFVSALLGGARPDVDPDVARRFASWST